MVFAFCIVLKHTEDAVEDGFDVGDKERRKPPPDTKGSACISCAPVTQAAAFGIVSWPLPFDLFWNLLMMVFLT